MKIVIEQKTAWVASFTCRLVSIEVATVEPEVFQDQVEVSTVGFEVEIEQVPDQWNAAGRRVEAEVGQHPEKFIVRYPRRRASLTM